MRSLNNMFKHSKFFSFHFQIKFHGLIIMFFVLRLFSFNAQKNDNLFLFNPSDIKTSLLMENNILWPPMELNIAKEDSKMLNFLFQKKLNEYSFIDSALNRHKLSSKFGFLPLILSAYQDHYTSNLSGRGIWSLSYITALKMNLYVNSYMDQRLDEKASTLAAIRHIKELSKIYKSDNWTLLSYITSPNYVSNIMKEANSNKWEEAIKFIDKKYLFNVELINWLDNIEYSPNFTHPKPSNMSEFIFEENIFFDAIAQFKIIDFQKIKRDNSVLLGQILPRDYGLKLEDEVGNFLKQNIQKILSFQDSMRRNLYLDTIQKSKKIHLVKQGDVLGQIAIDNNVSVKEIMSWNNLKNTIIYQDQKLILMSKHEFNNNKLDLKIISKEKYFWEIAVANPQVTIKKICKYNYYRELKPNQQLRITKK